jgi:hypothetical protein
LNSPCNGWEHWYYEEPASGKMVVINRLREKAVEILGDHLAGE